MYQCAKINLFSSLKKCTRLLKFKVWVAKVRARTHTCDVRSHVCVCVRKGFKNMCAMCVRAGIFKLVTHHTRATALDNLWSTNLIGSNFKIKYFSYQNLGSSRIPIRILCMYSHLPFALFLKTNEVKSFSFFMQMHFHK